LFVALLFNFVLFTGTRNDQTIEIMTGQLEPPESWNDRKAAGMTGKARATGKPELSEKAERPD
jgi:hypothetical protein